MTNAGEVLSPFVLRSKLPMCVTKRVYRPKGDRPRESRKENVPWERGSRQDWPGKVDEEEPLTGAAHSSFVSAAGPPSLCGLKVWDISSFSFKNMVSIAHVTSISSGTWQQALNNDEGTGCPVT